jgi:hypothetical protein
LFAWVWHHSGSPENHRSNRTTLLFLTEPPKNSPSTYRAYARPTRIPLLIAPWMDAGPVHE